VVAAGLLGAQSITWVDQELRVIYTEYTLAATNLEDIHGELIRYRTSVIRAVEADSREDVERIAAGGQFYTGFGLWHSGPVPARPRKKNPAAVALGRLGASKGGKARAAKLSANQRRKIAKKAARTRWS